jgi:hypothetical protein
MTYAHNTPRKVTATYVHQNAGIGLTVANQTYVDRAVLNQNDSYNNIAKCGIPRVEHPVAILLT